MSKHPITGNTRHGLSLDAGRTRSEESWIEISSQPSSSSLSSAADEIVTTGLRVHQTSASYRRRRQRPGRPSRLNIASRAGSVGAASSQEEYEESESDDDHIISSSAEGLTLPATHTREAMLESSDDDENRTAVNYPINSDSAFTPQPNAFSHPSAHSARRTSQPVPGSYFPAQPERRSSARHSYPSRADARVQHSPFNMLSPSHNAAADHEAALRASLSTLQSFAAAARGLPKSNTRPAAVAAPPSSNRIQPNTLRMVPASALENNSPPLTQNVEPTFKPTIRRASTSTSASADVRSTKSEAKRKGASGRGSSKERRAIKKRRNSGALYGVDEMTVSPTLFTWVVSVGVVVVFSAISFSAGYSMGKDAGRFESGMAGTADGATACAREAGKSGLGFKKSRLFSIASGVGVGA
ncbi:hypothetical protein AUEXF2481DRAFT_40583 [Aureobasidium subglaciale EXF-2481]|uniref:Uncharacterized protein n=1 Tax=Aureobasidium subglaciale (strain EXF-2481) TaxID=1043005 RepID=A0A074YKP9_AURSE|nr:uncharacterized protein AUEXF2481DRAFT_40583 [Aureobasidium subglaciale EXF-2481]KAI5231777.1 hypothetical protein E4T40_00517 [Aureobasidium subglaciale]KEQ94647.1 hypothetical protein AUEXF2481DRAFT_40583 [Aureobasidium subglaciale EXF-2481]